MGMDDYEIWNELRCYKSTRKALIKLNTILHDNVIECTPSGSLFPYNGPYLLYSRDNGHRCYICAECRKLNKSQIFTINNNFINFYICNNCINKHICTICFRETSRCSIIHTRKLLTWQILLSQKFPKDIIRLITKKVK